MASSSGWVSPHPGWVSPHPISLQIQTFSASADRRLRRVRPVSPGFWQPIVYRRDRRTCEHVVLNDVPTTRTSSPRRQAARRSATSGLKCPRAAERARGKHPQSPSMKLEARRRPMPPPAHLAPLLRNLQAVSWRSAGGLSGRSPRGRAASRRASRAEVDVVPVRARGRRVSSPSSGGGSTSPSGYQRDQTRPVGRRSRLVRRSHASP
jgi:hypothetical protein